MSVEGKASPCSGDGFIGLLEKGEGFNLEIDGYICKVDRSSIIVVSAI
jgi:hypothetical protein